MVSGYLQNSGKIFITLNQSVEEDLKKINSELDIKTLNTMTTLETKEWVKF